MSLTNSSALFPHLATTSVCGYQPYASRSVNRIELLGTEHLGDPHLLAVEGLRLGLKPTINRMRSVITPLTQAYYTHPLAIISLDSLMGATAVPSMMIRTVVGGTDVEQSVRLQIIITFMIAASTTLSCIVATHFVLWICVDSGQHIRGNWIDTRPHVVRRVFNRVILAIINIVGHIRRLTMSCVERLLQRGARFDNNVPPSERSVLLNGSRN